jgi:hypothetical protein
MVLMNQGPPGLEKKVKMIVHLSKKDVYYSKSQKARRQIKVNCGLDMLDPVEVPEDY